MTKILVVTEVEDDRHLLTVPEAALRLGVTPRVMRKWLLQRRVRGEKNVLVPFGKTGDLFRREWRIPEGNLEKPLRRQAAAGTMAAAVLAFMRLTKTSTVELAYKCQVCVTTIQKLRRGRMPRPQTLRQVYRAYPEQIDDLIQIIEEVGGPGADAQVLESGWDMIAAKVKAQAPGYFNDQG